MVRLRTNGTFTCRVCFPGHPTVNVILRALILRASVRIFIALEWASRVGFNILKVYRLGLRNPELFADFYGSGSPAFRHFSIGQTDRFLRRPFVSSTRPSLRESAGGSYTECLTFWSLRPASLRPPLYCWRPHSMNELAINNVSLSTSIYRVVTLAKKHKKKHSY